MRRKHKPIFIGDVEIPENYCFGISIKNQEEADRDIPTLLKVPAAKRFIRVTPSEPIDLKLYMSGEIEPSNDQPFTERGNLIDWVICELEKGVKTETSEARYLRDQCYQSGIPFFIC